MTRAMLQPSAETTAAFPLSVVGLVLPFVWGARRSASAAHSMPNGARYRSSSLPR